MDNYIKKMADFLIEKNPEEYQLNYADYGYIHNGVGMVSCGGEWEYNEEKAYDDAKEILLEELEILARKRKGIPEGYLLEFLEHSLLQEDVYNFIKTKIENS